MFQVMEGKPQLNYRENRQRFNCIHSSSVCHFVRDSLTYDRQNRCINMCSVSMRPTRAWFNTINQCSGCKTTVVRQYLMSRKQVLHELRRIA